MAQVGAKKQTHITDPISRIRETGGEGEKQEKDHKMRMKTDVQKDRREDVGASEEEQQEQEKEAKKKKGRRK
jgi:hypothetical protein